MHKSSIKFFIQLTFASVSSLQPANLGFLGYEVKIFHGAIGAPACACSTLDTLKELEIQKMRV